MLSYEGDGTFTGDSRTVKRAMSRIRGAEKVMLGSTCSGSRDVNSELGEELRCFRATNGDRPHFQPLDNQLFADLLADQAYNVAAATSESGNIAQPPSQHTYKYGSTKHERPNEKEGWFAAFSRNSHLLDATPPTFVRFPAAVSPRIYDRLIR